MTQITIRPAVAQDAETIFFFIRELAIYERAEHEVVTNADAIRQSILHPIPPYVP